MNLQLANFPEDLLLKMKMRALEKGHKSLRECIISDYTKVCGQSVTDLKQAATVARSGKKKTQKKK